MSWTHNNKAEQSWSAVFHSHLQVLFFPAEGVRQVLDVPVWRFLNVRMKRLQNFTDQRRDLLDNTAWLFDFVHLQINMRLHFNNYDTLCKSVNAGMRFESFLPSWSAFSASLVQPPDIEHSMEHEFSKSPLLVSCSKSRSRNTQEIWDEHFKMYLEYFLRDCSTLNKSSNRRFLSISTMVRNSPPFSPHFGQRF